MIFILGIELQIYKYKIKVFKKWYEHIPSVTTKYQDDFEIICDTDMKTKFKRKQNHHNNF